jgi:hypothetical protein
MDRRQFFSTAAITAMTPFIQAKEQPGRLLFDYRRTDIIPEYANETYCQETGKKVVEMMRYHRAYLKAPEFSDGGAYPDLWPIQAWLLPDDRLRVMSYRIRSDKLSSVEKDQITRKVVEYITYHDKWVIHYHNGNGNTMFIAVPG